MVTIHSLRKEQPQFEYDFKVDRSSPLGNPFPLKNEKDRDEVCDRYRQYFHENKSKPKMRFTLALLLHMYKKYSKLRLFCWCAPKRCHAETVAEYIRSLV